MEPILRNNKINDSLENEGYAVVDFFNSNQIQDIIHLNRSCTKFYPKFKLDFSFMNSNPQKYILAEHKFKEKYSNSILKHFINYSILGIGFINKGIGFRNSIPFHQDWTICNEQIFKPIAIWLPLQKLNNFCGEMYIIPKSHLLATGIRTHNHYSLTIPFNDKKIKPFIKKVDLKLGEAIVYFPNLFHATNYNRKLWIRRAITLTLTPINCKLLFYSNTKNKNEFEFRKLPNDFYKNYDDFIKKNNYLNENPLGKIHINSNINNTKDLIDSLKKL